ncbi:Reverse transcriptase (RNA-dependent DNA polymerase) [Fragilaria crotonensis]|nr:Reverse transcriptase (RNA-dependent DNA polymerase) [Fragilaria crotonensis]
MTKEFVQMEVLNVYHSVKASSMTPLQRKTALRAVNLLIKEKQDGNLRGRTCADGRPQRRFYEMAQTTSPTVSNHALVISIIERGRIRGPDVEVGDIAGGRIKADMDDFVVMKITGEAVTI